MEPSQSTPVNIPFDLFTELKKNNDESRLSTNESISPFDTGAISKFFFSTFSILTEFILYLLALACLVFIFIMKNITPFHVLSEIKHKRIVTEALGKSEVELFDLAIKGLFIVIALLLFILAFQIRKRRIYSRKVREWVRNMKQVDTSLKHNQDILNKLDTSVRSEEMPSIRKFEPRKIDQRE